MTVSYTHLDVYKRQLLGFFAAACDPMDDIYNEIDAEGTTNTQTMAEYVPVSYTHLSVIETSAVGAVTAIIIIISPRFL